MPPRRAIATARDLLRKLTADSKLTKRIVREGRREQARGVGMNSLFAWPVLAALRKLKGKGAVDKALYSKFHRPLKNADERLGRLLEKELGTKKLFRQVDVLPTRRTMGRHKALIKHETHSATAPVSKAVKVITPLAATLYVADKLDKTGEEKMADQAHIEDKDVLLKEAADALDVAQRRDVDMPDFGKVASEETAVPADATSAFYHRLAED